MTKTKTRYKQCILYSIFTIAVISACMLFYCALNEQWMIKYFSFVSAFTLLVLVIFSIRLISLAQANRQDFENEIKKEMTKRLHIEESKQQLEKALLQGQKLQAIGTLAGGIAHDFNNILYAIIGYVEMAREDADEKSLIYKNLGKVLEASHRGQELIARILAFGRRQHHDYQPILLQDTIEGVLALLKPTIPASVTIEFYPLRQDHSILGNPTQMHQVIVNIINNAVDAMEGEGLVTIKLSYILANDDILESIRKIANRNYCKIEITDNGQGMDQGTLSRIFEPFFTTKEVGKGSGLGLATVHAIIEEHQGQIKVDSRIGHGTTFTLWLPEYKQQGA